jgi:hypothetical protein
MKNNQSIEKALHNAISSVEMEGYKFTEFHKQLCRDVLSGKITKEECIKMIIENNKE